MRIRPVRPLRQPRGWAWNLAVPIIKPALLATTRPSWSGGEKIPDDRRLHPRAQPHLARRPAHRGAHRLRPRPAAALPGQVGAVPQPVHAVLHDRGRPDPGRAAEPQRVGAYDAAVAAVRAGECVVGLPRGHDHPRPRPVADDGQVRRGPHRAGHRVPGDPDRAVGRAGAAAAVHQRGPTCSRASRSGWWSATPSTCPTCSCASRRPPSWPRPPSGSWTPSPPSSPRSAASSRRPSATT